MNESRWLLAVYVTVAPKEVGTGDQQRFTVSEEATTRLLVAPMTHSWTRGAACIHITASNL